LCKSIHFVFDFQGNGSVDFDEFLTMMQRRRSTGESDTELYQVFQVNRFVFSSLNKTKNNFCILFKGF